MDSFSLLKYWRGGGGASATRDSPAKTRTTTDSCSSTTIVAAVSPSSSDSENVNDDDGPFFDLEFTLPDDSDAEDQIKEDRNIAAIVEDFVNENDFKDPSLEQNQNGLLADVLSDDNEINEGDEIKFMLSSSSSSDSEDPNTALSPSGDLFFKGRLVPIESSSLSLSSPESDAITKFPVSSILKSATNFRVLMLKFNKSKSNVREKSKKSEAAVFPPKEGQDKRQQSKFFTVKLKVEEVPLVSLFTRDNNLKGNSTATKGSKKSNNDVEISDSSSGSTSAAPDDKKFSKDVMQKYLKKVKPLYIRVSKRYGEKLRLSGQLSFPKSGGGPSPAPPPTAEVKSPPSKSTNAKGASEASEGAELVALPNSKSQKQGNLQAGLRVVCKHLGKSRSASSAAAAVAPSAPFTSNRRDDSLLEQQDGIRSAILHCKRSFNASTDLEGSILSRSASDTSHEKSITLSTEESSSSSEDANGQGE